MKTETDDRTIQTPEDVLQGLRSFVTEAEHILGHAPKGDREATRAARSATHRTVNQLTAPAARAIRAAEIS